WSAPTGPEGYRALAVEAAGATEGSDEASRGTARIVYAITRSDTIGGAQIHVRDLSGAMTDAGHSVVAVVGGDGDGRYAEVLRDRGVSVVNVPELARALSVRGDLRAARVLGDVLRDLEPDLISLHSSKA